MTSRPTMWDSPTFSTRSSGVGSRISTAARMRQFPGRKLGAASVSGNGDAVHPSIRWAALDDMSDAYDWYETQRPGLGEEFLAAIDGVMSAISESPKRRIHASGRLVDEGVHAADRIHGGRWREVREVNGGTQCSPSTGYLALEAEGALAEFRNLRIRELP